MPIGLFRFWKKEQAKIKVPVSQISLFSSLTPTELRLIENKIRRVEYKKGDIVYHIGQQAEAFFVILSGRFRVIGPRKETLSVLSQGDYFGESSILLGREHSATIQAKNDGLVFRIEKKEFQNLLKEIPSLSLHLSRTLGHRLSMWSSGSEVAETKVVSIFACDDEQQKRLFAWNLAAMLGTDGREKTILVGVEAHGQHRYKHKQSTPLVLSGFEPESAHEVEKLIQEQKGSFFFLNIKNGLEGPDLEKRVSALLNYLINRYGFVLLDLPSELDEISMKVLKQSDLIYFIVPEEKRNSSRTKDYLKEFKSSCAFTADEIRFILSARTDGREGKAYPYRLNDASTVPVFRFLPPESGLEVKTGVDELPFVLRDADSPYSKVIRFLARELRGRLVGLALGSGAAFGFAHIGVIKVLEESKIPIDIVSGSSIGAVVACMWASGMDARQLEQVARTLDRKSIFFKLVGFRDLSIAHRGFFKGRQVSRFLRSHLQRNRLQRTNIPVKVVATDLATSEEVIFDEGDMVDAVRASISIPGIFRAVHRKGDILIDGGVVDPLPIKVLSRYGVKKIIAVNVLPSPDDHIQRKEMQESQRKELDQSKERKSIFGHLTHTLGERMKKRLRDNIFNVLMNTIQFLEYGMAESSAGDADIVIHPVVSDSHWAEFYSVDKFVQCGEEKTREQLDEIRKLAAEDHL